MLYTYHVTLGLGRRVKRKTCSEFGAAVVSVKVVVAAAIFGVDVEEAAAAAPAEFPADALPFPGFWLLLLVALLLILMMQFFSKCCRCRLFGSG